MKLINPLLALLITIGINYQSFGQAGVTSTDKMEHDGIMREYILHIPTNYGDNETYPLLLNFHGYGSNATQHMQYSRFNDLADRENFIVVYPEGTMLEDKTHWNVGGWTLASKVDDVSFVNALIDKLASDYKVDKSRIYATGMSNGGYMSFLLACQLSDKIAAIASVTGSMTPQTFKSCNPEHPMPILQLHGDTDPTVPYEGDFLWTMPIEKVVEYWTTANQTSTSAITEELPDVVKEDNSTVIKYTYNKGNNGSSVIHYKVLNGQHDWFGARGNMDIDSSEIIWDFVSQYSLDGKISN